MSQRTAANLAITWIAPLAFLLFSGVGLLRALDQHQTTRAWLYGVSVLLWLALFLGAAYQVWRKPRR